MDRKLINYLPPVLRDVLDFKALNEAVEPEIARAWDALMQVMANQFLDTADRNGVSIWERELNIRPRDTETLEERKAHIKALWNLELPYTLPQLRAILETLCGRGNCSASVDGYILVVRVGLAAKNNYRNVESLLQQVLPANIVADLSLLYNRWADCRGTTWRGLATRTWRQMREEVIP